jgi:deoxycytidine triphosphate deaminase
MNSGGILSGPAIRNAIRDGNIKISPFDLNDPKCSERINPASVDLTLGDQVAVYMDTTVPNFGYSHHYSTIEFGKEISGIAGERVKPQYDYATDKSGFSVRTGCLDSAKENPVARHTMKKEGFILMPGVGYLMHTAERIYTDRYVPIIDGKSSIGRLFCLIHFCAGFGDVGFDGQYTLEVSVLQPLIVYPGMRFCQIRFHTLVGEIQDYKEKGNYTGEFAEGPVPSRSWKMFNGE